MEVQKYMDNFKGQAEAPLKQVLHALLDTVIAPAIIDAAAASETKVDDVIVSALLSTGVAAAHAAIDSVKL